MATRKYRRVFAAKGQQIGEVVELHDDEATALVKWGRVVPVEDEPTEPERAASVDLVKVAGKGE